MENGEGGLLVCTLEPEGWKVIFSSYWKSTASRYFIEINLYFAR